MLDAHAFDSAYRQYSRALVGYAERASAGSADAPDLAHDAWVAAWAAREGIDRPGLWSWLCRVVRRAWWWRLNPTKGRTPAPEMVPEIEAGERVIEPEQEAVAQRAQIARAARGLPSARARAVEYALADHDTGETGKALGMTTSAASDALRRAVATLRNRWGLE